MEDGMQEVVKRSLAIDIAIKLAGSTVVNTELSDIDSEIPNELTASSPVR
jgi:hypothetical protein